MKTAIRITLVVLTIAFAFSTWSMAADAAADYKAKCAACHGPDGKGDTAMGKKLGIKDFSSAEVQGMSDADLTNIITKGKDKMPAYDGKLTKDQIDGIVKWIRTLKK
jgi:mono/diheme cytochrome c family protein